MSNKPLGPGWWLASDGTWHPPEDHPSISGSTPVITASDVPPVPAASLPSTGSPLPELTSMPEIASVEEGTAPPAMVAPPAPPGPVPGDGTVATVEMPPLGPLAPRPVPSLGDAATRPTWSGESDHRPEAGPMFPDLFQQAVAGSVLANAVTVNFADGEHRDSLDVPMPSGPHPGSDDLVSASGRVPAEVGAFIGASARKRRWRH